MATIQRKLLVLEDQGGANLFGEPALALADLMRTDAAGRGYVNLLAADRLIASPTLYATFLLWLMSALFDEGATPIPLISPAPPIGTTTTSSRGSSSAISTATAAQSAPSATTSPCASAWPARAVHRVGPARGSYRPAHNICAKTIANVLHA